MKHPFLFLAGIFISLAITAQDFKKLPAFGEVNKEELQMTECDFEKGAAAMVMFKEGESFYRLKHNPTGKPYFLQTNIRERIKIFNTQGFNNANIKIQYPSDNRYVSIINFEAQTYNIDASGNIRVSKVEKATVYNKIIDNHKSELSFAFPDVRSGSVLEYKYTFDNALPSDWYFQDDIPVKYSRFILNFPPELEMLITPICTLPVQNFSSNKNGAGNYKWYAMENITGLTHEPYMSCSEDYLQKLEIQLAALDMPGQIRKNMLSTWPEIIKELLDDEAFGKQLKKDIPLTADLDAMIKGINNPFKKMYAIHNYVRSNMEWNGYNNIEVIDGVKSAWKNRKGTSGEINLILINLLMAEGFKVQPILVSTKNNGLVNISVAKIDQFDKVMAHVTIGDKYYVLDAAENATPSSLIPLNVMVSEALIIASPDSYEWGWKTLWDNNHQFCRSVMLNAEADTNGNLKGAAKLIAIDYERCKILSEEKNNTKNSLGNLEGVNIDSIVTENEETDTLPLVKNIYFKASGSSSGEYKYFSLNLFTGLEKNPFLAEERTTDIFYSANQKYEIKGTVFLPEGYIIEELPQNVRMIMPDTSIIFLRKSSFNDGILTIDYQLEFKRPFFAKDEYPEFREFYKKLYALLNEQYVYRKQK